MKPSQIRPPPLEFIFAMARLLTFYGLILYFVWITCFYTTPYYLRAKAMLDQTALYFCSLNYSINGIQTCDLNLSKSESFKLLWKTNTIILDERFSTGGDSGTSGIIWQHVWLSQKGRREILVSGGKRPGILQNIQQCTQQPPAPTEKSIMLRLKNALDY